MTCMGPAEVALVAYLHSVTAVAGTSPTGRVSAKCELTDEQIGSYRLPSFVLHDSPTNISAEATRYVPQAYPEETVVADVMKYANLREGWDGEAAAAPKRKSLDQAIDFIRLCGTSGANFEPSLHVDGTVILDRDDDLSVRFLGDDRISVVHPEGSLLTDFDGTAIPHDLALIMRD